MESGFSFSPDVIAKALKNIYAQKFDPLTDIEENLFDETWKNFNTAVDKGVSFSGYNPGDDFIRELKYNNAVFSAFRTHRMQNDIAAQLLDADGKLKPFGKFVKDVAPIADHHVKHWMQTEYNTAVIRAHRAADWKRFDAEKDILPNLEWIPTTSVTPGEDHRIFWGIIRPVEDQFWNEHRPGDRWNCKCRLQATDKPATTLVSRSEPIAKASMPQRGLENNPATSGMIFSMGHPFFTAGYLAYKKLAPIVDTFVNKQLSKVAIKNIKKVKAGIDKFDGILMKNKMFKTGEMIVLRNSLDAIMQHGLRDKRIKIWLMNFRTDKISKMEYIGWDYPKKYKPTDPKYDPNNPDKFKHAETHYFLYYKTKIMGKTYYANVKLHKNYNKEVLYTLEKTKPEVIRTDEPPNIFKKRKS